MSLQIGGGKPPGRRRRSRVDRITTGWMILAAVLFVYNRAFGGTLSQQWWTTVHIITLGVITNAILQWSWYFARSLLRLPADNRNAGAHQTLRQLLFNTAVVVLVVAMWVPSPLLAIVAATAVGVIIVWHVVALVVSSRTALGARFAVIVRYYVAAGAMLVVGIVYGALTVVPLLAPTSPAVLVELQNGLTIAHSLVNGLGFVGLTIAGTLVTLGPTALRTRMDQDAVERAVGALPILVVSVVGAVLASTWQLLPLAGVLTLVYTAALVWGVGVGLAHAALRKPLAEVSTWSFALGVVWSLAGLLWLAGALLAGTDGGQFRETFRLIVAVIGVGGVLQILIGALSYLLPVVVGGGPGVVRIGIHAIEAGGGMRVGARNAALLAAVTIAVVGGISAAPFAAVVAATYFLDIIAFGRAGIRQARRKRLAQTSRASGGDNS